MRISLVITGIVFLGLTMPHLGCQSSAIGGRRRSIPVPRPERAAELPPEQLREASQLYAIKCAKCHEFYNPADYPPAEWEGWMRKMTRKARLGSTQADLLSRYFETFRPLSKSPERN
jgi:hypothetical protein